MVHKLGSACCDDHACANELLWCCGNTFHHADMCVIVTSSHPAATNGLSALQLKGLSHFVRKLVR
jgi:hypothetical protein